MAIEKTDEGQALSLPFQAEEMSYVRMTQADIARLFDVSRARVSQWVKQGKITAYADGRIDPSRAAAELVRNCNLNRLQAKPFKPLRKELDVVRAQHAELKLERDRLAAELERMRQHARRLFRAYLEVDAWLAAFFEATAATAADPEQTQAAFDAAGDAALAADLAELVRTLDPDLSGFLAELHPELASNNP